MTSPGEKPVTALPGLTPRSPVMTLEPVLVTVEAPSTAKLCAQPSDGEVAEAPKPALTAIWREAQKFTLPAPAPIRPPSSMVVAPFCSANFTCAGDRFG